MGVDSDATAGAEFQLVAHQVDPLLASELENDSTDLELPVLAGGPGRRPRAPSRCSVPTSLSSVHPANSVIRPSDRSRSMRSGLADEAG